MYRVTSAVCRLDRCILGDQSRVSLPCTVDQHGLILESPKQEPLVMEAFTIFDVTFIYTIEEGRWIFKGLSISRME